MTQELKDGDKIDVSGFDKGYATWLAVRVWRAEGEITQIGVSTVEGNPNFVGQRSGNDVHRRWVSGEEHNITKIRFGKEIGSNKNLHVTSVTSLEDVPCKRYAVKVSDHREPVVFEISENSNGKNITLY